MEERTLTLALSDPDDSRPGGLVPEILTALEGVQNAVRLMVQHLGERDRGPGKPPRWVRDQSTLRLVGVREGSLIADLVVEPPADSQSYMDDFGNQAIAALQEWNGEQSSILPKDVEDALHSTASRLSHGVSLWLGNRENPRSVQVPRRSRPSRRIEGATEALLQGWLYEVNWERGTAQLHDYSGEYVQLRFARDLHEDMLRLATQHVEVRGEGRFKESDDWTTVKVEEIRAARSSHLPFDVEAFLNDPRPKIFDPQGLVTSSEPFDVDEFVHVIRKGRDEGRKPAE